MANEAYLMQVIYQYLLAFASALPASFVCESRVLVLNCSNFVQNRLSEELGVDGQNSVMLFYGGNGYFPYFKAIK